MSTEITVDVADLESKVKEMYRRVAQEPDEEYHFEMGRSLAERLGYPSEALDEVPSQAIESFAGVGYFFDLGQLTAGERVVDLGSGSGMDAFFAANAVGPDGSVIGIDFTPEQLKKAAELGSAAGFDQVEFREGRIEDMPVETDSIDVAISNGVINLAPDKPAVFAEAARVLRPGGRLALSDIISEVRLSRGIVCNADLWAACIGGASQRDDYLTAISEAGFDVHHVKDNPYRFISDQAMGATEKYQVKSISVLAIRKD
jgi:arsenite methyltransferase